MNRKYVCGHFLSVLFKCQMIEYRMSKNVSPCLRGQNSNRNGTRVKIVRWFFKILQENFFIGAINTNIKHGAIFGVHPVHLSHTEDWQKSDNQNSMYTHLKTFTVYEIHTFDMSINEPACPWIAAPWHNPVFADLDLISLYFRSRSIHNER